MEKKPKISVCIPAYRQPELVRRALDSLVRQSFRDFEVVITDDSDYDEVEKVALKFSKDLRLKYLRNHSPQGAPQNWNESVRHAEGEYVKMLHHDDWFHGVDGLEKYVSMLDEHPECDFAFSGSLNLDPHGNLRSVHSASSNEIGALKRNSASLMLGNFIGAPSATVYRRRSGVEYDPQLKWLVDIDFYIRLLQRNPKFVCTREPLVSVTVDSPFRVTAGAESNRYVEVNEHLILYRKLKDAGAVNYRIFRYVSALLQKYRIESTDEIFAVGPVDSGCLRDLESMLKSQARWMRIKPVFRVLKKVLSPEAWVREGFGFSAYLVSRFRKSNPADANRKERKSESDLTF